MTYNPHPTPWPEWWRNGFIDLGRFLGGALIVIVMAYIVSHGSGGTSATHSMGWN